MKAIDAFTRRAAKLVKNNQLVSGIALVVLITGLLTTVNMILYVTSGTSGLDLSRPGFDAARKNIEKDDQTTSTFSATGTLNDSDVDTFVTQYTEQRNKLKGIGTFGDESLTDDSLGLTMPDPQSTEPQ